MKKFYSKLTFLILLVAVFSCEKQDLITEDQFVSTIS